MSKLIAGVVGYLVSVPVAWAEESAIFGTDLQEIGFDDAGQPSLAKVGETITNLSGYLIGLAILIAILFVVIGGWQYVTGAVSGKEEGKQTIMYALLGLAVALLSWVIVNTIAGLVSGG